MKLDNDSIEVRSSVEQKSRLQDEAKKRFSREVQLAKLKEALKEAESTAEQIADNFLSGTMSCDDFLSDYPEVGNAYVCVCVQALGISRYIYEQQH
mmetsp:Transcript_4068/g.7907  ORF Transcript_4068/g.7907 Transcript_4068/m.7907 type:complete len:96 (+) Transcript_4068:993-1280(+)